MTIFEAVIYEVVVCSTFVGPVNERAKGQSDNRGLTILLVSVHITKNSVNQWN